MGKVAAFRSGDEQTIGYKRVSFRPARRKRINGGYFDVLAEEGRTKSIPVGALGIIAMNGCGEIGEKVDNYLVKGRENFSSELKEDLTFYGYIKDSYLLNTKCPRFGTGEAKGIINESVRGQDIFIIVDVFNYGCKYTMYGKETCMSPDDHFQDLKRIISAIAGKARRITVIMPMLYEGRQHRRTYRESLDCAIALQELVNIGVNNIITFDAHDNRVHNAIPFGGFENVMPTYQMIKALIKNVPDVEFSPDKMMIISPDEGGISRNIYFSSVLGLSLGMYYKKRDYTTVVNGLNPIVAHEFLGESVEGKDLIIADDIIDSGWSIMDLMIDLKKKKANRIFLACTFGLFTKGFEKLDEAYKEGLFTKIFTTNLNYRPRSLFSKEWYCEVDMSKYIAYIIDTLNHDQSIGNLLEPSWRIKKLLHNKGYIK